MQRQNSASPSIVFQTLLTSGNPTDRRPSVPEFHGLPVLPFPVFDYEIQRWIVGIDRKLHPRVPIASEKIEPVLSLGLLPEYLVTQINNVVFVSHRYIWPTPASAAVRRQTTASNLNRLTRGGRLLHAVLSYPVSITTSTRPLSNPPSTTHVPI